MGTSCKCQVPPSSHESGSPCPPTVPQSVCAWVCVIVCAHRTGGNCLNDSCPILHCSFTHLFNHLSRVIHLCTEHLIYSSGLLEQLSYHICMDKGVGGNLGTITAFHQRQETVSANQEHKKLHGKRDRGSI